MNQKTIGIGVLVLAILAALFFVLRNPPTKTSDTPVSADNTSTQKSAPHTPAAPPTPRESGPSDWPSDTKPPNRNLELTEAHSSSEVQENKILEPLTDQQYIGYVVEFSSGQPVPDIRLSVQDNPNVVIADENGRFTLPPLSPGNHAITVMDDMALLAYNQGALQFVVDPAVEPADLKLEIIFCGIIEGSVWFDGEPFEGAQLSVRPAVTDSTSQTPQNPKSGVTDDEGNFHVYRLLPGEVMVQARLQLETGGETFKIVPAIIEEGSVTKVDIDFFKSLEGHLIYGDYDVRNAVVSVVVQEDENSEPQQFNAPVADDGTYWVDSLPTGIHRVVAQAFIEGQGNVQKFAWVETQEGQVTYQAFDFTEGATIIGIIVDVVPNENVSILVLDGTNEEHDYMAADYDTLANINADRLYGIDATGRFTIPGLELGNYTVLIKSTAYDDELGQNITNVYGPAVVNLQNIGDAIMEIKRVLVRR